MSLLTHLLFFDSVDLQRCERSIRSLLEIEGVNNKNQRGITHFIIKLSTIFISSRFLCCTQMVQLSSAEVTVFKCVYKLEEMQSQDSSVQSSHTSVTLATVATSVT